MKQANVKLYIRFGDIPDDGMSKVHLSDYEARSEGGLSVWRAVEANGRYYPVLPEDANEAAIADFFNFLMCDKGPVYLLTGEEIRMEGADREPLLQKWVVLEEITHYYGKAREEEYEKRVYPARFDKNGKRKKSAGKVVAVRTPIKNIRGDIYGGEYSEKGEDLK